jgi:hypothetical protein
MKYEDINPMFISKSDYEDMLKALEDDTPIPALVELLDRVYEAGYDSGFDSATGRF